MWLIFWMIAGSTFLFLIVFLVNEWIFNSSTFEVLRGINWIYLPAGMRLLCTLLFGGPGAIGVLIASWITSTLYYFPNDPLRAFAGGIASAAAPYLVYKLAQFGYGLQPSLTNLNAQRLMILAVAYSVASPLLHHIWFFLNGEPLGLNFFVMVLGDFIGTLTVLYTLKFVLSMVPIREPVR